MSIGRRSSALESPNSKHGPACFFFPLDPASRTVFRDISCGRTRGVGRSATRQTLGGGRGGRSERSAKKGAGSSEQKREIPTFTRRKAIMSDTRQYPPQPSGRNSLAEEIKNSHPEPGPLMASIVHVNMGHCPYYHITFRKAPRPYTQPGIAYKYQQLQNPGVVRFASVLLRLSRLDGNSIIYGRQSGLPLAIALTLRFIGVFFIFRRIHARPRPRSAISPATPTPRVADPPVRQHHRSGIYEI